MHRFSYPSSHILGKKIIINNQEQVHHLRDVLRLKLKDKIIVFDDKGNEYDCIIENVFKQITLNIANMRSPSGNAKVKITVACAIPKKSKMDDIIDKLTQLGVDRIIPLETERVVIKLDKNKKILRQKRWERIALSASQQSQRNNFPVIESFKNIKEVLAEAKNYDLKIIPTLTGETKNLKDIFSRCKPKDILIFIGPEGDFSNREVELVKAAGCIPVSLGNLVLRVETAAVATVSFIRFLYENS